jgi:hypothetical protein
VTFVFNKIPPDSADLWIYKLQHLYSKITGGICSIHVLTNPKRFVLTVNDITKYTLTRYEYVSLNILLTVFLYKSKLIYFDVETDEEELVDITYVEDDAINAILNVFQDQLKNINKKNEAEKNAMYVKHIFRDQIEPAKEDTQLSTMVEEDEIDSTQSFEDEQINAEAEVDEADAAAKVEADAAAHVEARREAEDAIVGEEQGDRATYNTEYQDAVANRSRDKHRFSRRPKPKEEFRSQQDQPRNKLNRSRSRSPRASPKEQQKELEVEDRSKSREKDQFLFRRKQMMNLVENPYRGGGSRTKKIKLLSLKINTRSND